ncbi:MAG TPA: DsbA family protein [Thermoplasmata archaeon]|jgi:protein-disulfide isomerase|nr:DsbA family protein [Thermoplasmata archaeon]
MPRELVAEKYEAPRLVLPVGERDHAAGPAAAAAVLVEYGDYQCPYCGAAYPIVKQIQKHFGDRLRFVFRNFPITNAHPRAEWAAELAEAAGAQGRFWEMHDFLYEHQAKLDDATVFAKQAKRLKLDARRIDAEVGDHSYLARIQEDYTSGIRSGVNGTPTFFINGVRYDGYPELAPLVAALDAAGRPAASR